MARKDRSLSKKQLEIQLGKLDTLENPQLSLEQYTVSPETASELLLMAGFEHDDLEGTTVDLGTGTGRLAIGAALMGAKEVIGLDIDRRSIKLAVRNGLMAKVEVNWVVGDLEAIRGKFDIVLMNPPYGTRSPHADVRFLSQAFQLAPISYSIHKSSTRKFLVHFIEKNGRHVDQVRSMAMPIPHLFSFHTKKSRTVQVDLYRIMS